MVEGMDAWSAPERFVGIVVKDGSNLGRARAPNPIPHKDMVLSVAKSYLNEIDLLVPMLTIFRDTAHPPSGPVRETRQRLAGFIVECERALLSKSELFSHIALDPDVNDMLSTICDTGDSPVGSVFDIPAWREQRRREIEDRNFAFNLEQNTARKKAREEEKAKKEEQERKRKQLADDLGVNLGPLPRTG